MTSCGTASLTAAKKERINGKKTLMGAAMLASLPSKSGKLRGEKKNAGEYRRKIVVTKHNN